MLWRKCSGASCRTQKVHAVGYCIGGTLLAIAAAALAARHESPLASVESVRSADRLQRAGRAVRFHHAEPDRDARGDDVQGRRARERAHGRSVRAAALARPAVDARRSTQYVRGERPKLNDLMAWNADGTRMPWRMHSEYLERLYLKNELALGTFTVEGARIDLKSVHRADVRGWHRDRSCRPVALGVQDAQPDPQHRLHLPAHQRRS